jgi:glycogen debranching enzyme
MKDNGFNISIRTDWSNTGFTFGGNSDNCGTWMDKMGSASHNKGVPATPRDGAPIELVALQYSVLTFLDTLHTSGKFKTGGVSEGSFKEWATKISSNFDKCFYVPERGATLASMTDQMVDYRHVQKYGIYKDVYGSTDPKAPY